MKQSELQLFKNSTDMYHLFQCRFKHEKEYALFYMLAHDNNLFLAAEENDFQISGFQIGAFSNLNFIEQVKDISAFINQENQILTSFQKPDIQLQSWQSVFLSLKELQYLVIIKNNFGIGRISDVTENAVMFEEFDPSIDLSWKFYKPCEILFSEITSIKFLSRYCIVLQNYLLQKEKLFQIVKKHIDAMDFLKLLALGAPSDEFDSISRTISQYLKPEMTVKEMIDLITSVFKKNFKMHYPDSYFEETAQNIKNELDQIS